MQKSKGLVSIIIPAFNEVKNIGKCLDSLLNQDYPYTEIIVVDDGSTDSTLEKLKEYPINILTQKHLGPAKARNFASEKAKGEVLVFVDADMIFENNFITDLVTPIIKNIYKGTFSKEEYISNWENIWSKCWNFNQNLPERKMIPNDYPDEGKDFRAILKEEFLKVNGFDDVGYTDTWSLSKKLGFYPHAVKGAKYYHSNPDNLMEVYNQAKWIGKREYKFGIIGVLATFIKHSLPFSVVVGLLKSLKYKRIEYIIFKIVYDFGIFFGICEMIITGKLSK